MVSIDAGQHNVTHLGGAALLEQCDAICRDRGRAVGRLAIDGPDEAQVGLFCQDRQRINIEVIRMRVGADNGVCLDLVRRNGGGHDALEPSQSLDAIG